MRVTAGSGNRFITRHNATKALALVWCLVVVVLIHGYIGKLISFLSVPKLKPIISSLEDLPASKLTWVIDRDTSLDSLFMVLYILNSIDSSVQLLIA